MKIKLVEVTNGIANWGKFLLGAFDTEWEYKSVIDGNSIIAGRGWSRDHILVLDLQTGEGAMFRLGGSAKADLDQHKIWVCPMYEPFLTWLYAQAGFHGTAGFWDELPAHVDLPDAEFAFAGYRRPGPRPDGDDALRERLKLRLSEKQRQCLEYVVQGEKPPFKITTVESLAKHGLVEHVDGVGWRATQAGVDELPPSYHFGARGVRSGDVPSFGFRREHLLGTVRLEDWAKLRGTDLRALATKRPRA